MTEHALHLLIVEGSVETAATLAAAAASRGYPAVCVSAPEDAIPTLERQAFDVAAIDLGDDDIYAFELLGTIRQRYPFIAAVVTSTTPTVERAVRSYELGAFRFVSKPYDAEQFLTTIEGQIGVAVQDARLYACMRRGKREWEQTFDAIGDPIAVYDAGGVLLRGNAALACHLDLPITALPGLTCREVGFCGGGCPACAVRRAATVSATAEVTCADGQIFSVTTFKAAGEPDGAAVVQVAKDVTAQVTNARRLRQMSEELAAANRRSTAALVQLKSAQAQLVQAEKLSAIGYLVSGVAHEMNNPLTSIIGSAQLLGDQIEARTTASIAAQLMPDVRRIAAESERAARIVRNLLAFARRQTTPRSPQDAAALFERTLAAREQALSGSGVSIERAFEAGLPPVAADAHQLEQALTNLVLNAEYAMRNRDVRRLRVGARFDETAGAVELFVTDSGHGIDPAELTRIFDPFFTTRDTGEGAGLGLSICYGIVRDHGGQILVDTTMNSGTTVSLLLPARLDDAQAVGDVLMAHAEGEGSVVGAALEGWGYRVAWATTTATAIERYARGVHALFLDASLLASDPEAWRAARQRTAVRAPLVLMGICDDAEVDRFRREQASAVLVPPFQLRPLWAAVRSLTKECV